MNSVFNLAYIFLYFVYSVRGLDFGGIEKVLESNRLRHFQDRLRREVGSNDLETLHKILENQNLNANVLEELLESNQKINAIVLEELLEIFVEFQNLNIIKYLVSEKHVNINNIALFRAARESNTEVLRYFLESGADPYTRDSDGNSLMHQAVMHNNVESVKLLSRYENLINSTNSNGQTPIDLTKWPSKHTAEKYTEVIKILVEAGSYVPDQLIWNFWYHQVSNDMIKLLVTKSGKVDLRITWTKRDCRETLLMMMLMEENLQYDMIKFLLDQGADVNIVYCSNMTALHRAAYFERENTLQVIQLLLDKGAHINAIDDKGFTPLDFADRRGNKKVAEYLRKSGGRNTQSYLFVRAADNNDLETMEQMLESDKNLLNRKLDYGETLLQAAATRGSLKIIKYLVSKQHVNINEQDIYGLTALSKAVEAGELESVKVLLELGADKSIKWTSEKLKVLEDGSTLLHHAARDGSEEVLRFLLQKYNVDIKNSDNETPAYIAAKEGKVGALKLLLMHGADPYTRNKDGSTMIHAAVKFNHVDVLRELIRFKELINATDQSNLLPIDITSSKQIVRELVNAGSDIPDSCILNYFDIGDIDLVKYLVIESGKVNLRLPRDCCDTLLIILLKRDNPPYDDIKLLLDKGADANIKFCDNMTALHRAAYFAAENYQQILDLLLDRGAEINARNIYGKTPLDYANENVAAYLRKLGGVSGHSSSTRNYYLAGKPNLKENLEKTKDKEEKNERICPDQTARKSDLMDREQSFSTPGPWTDDETKKKKKSPGR